MLRFHLRIIVSTFRPFETERFDNFTDAEWIAKWLSERPGTIVRVYQGSNSIRRYVNGKRIRKGEKKICKV